MFQVLTKVIPASRDLAPCEPVSLGKEQGAVLRDPWPQAVNFLLNNLACGLQIGVLNSWREKEPAVKQRQRAIFRYDLNPVLKGWLGGLWWPCGTDQTA